MTVQTAQLDALASERQRIAEALGGDAPAWLVGGIVRDALLGRPLLDVDLVVDGDPQRAARAIARHIGGSPFPLSDEHGCWRVTLAAEGSAQVDVCALQGSSLEEDLARRDFTMNAMAVDVADGALVDPTGGARDLADSIVRMVAPASLDADPLRLLRCVRFAAQLDFDIDPDTASAVAERAATASSPSGERIFAELNLLLSCDHPRGAIELLDRLELVAVLLPELHACRGLQQTLFHHLDVYQHTLAVLDNVSDVVAHPGHYLGVVEPAFAPQQFSEEQGLLLRWAALAHDLGKPATHSEHDGHHRFPGHDEAGVAAVDAMCDRWATSRRFRRDLSQLVRTHLVLGVLIHGELDRRASWRFFQAVDQLAPEAIVLSVADRLATMGYPNRRKWVRRHMEVARELWRLHFAERAGGPPAALLDGSAIAEAAGIDPGPMLGRLVRELAEEQWVGSVRSCDEARSFVRSRMGEGTRP